MNRKAIKSNVFCILAILLLLVAVSVPRASAEFYVIAGSRGVGTEIKSLPYTVPSSGFYYITKDLTCSSVIKPGILVKCDDVTIDLMGFRLTGPGGTGACDGIYMNGRTNVEIRNGTVKNFQQNGIYEDDSSGTGHRMFNLRLLDNGVAGIYLSGSNNIVDKCTAFGNDSRGIYVYNGLITSSTCYNNGTSGIDVGIGSTVIGNTCYANTGDGISGGNNSTIKDNTCFDNTIDGITTSINVTVTGNTCNDNNQIGIDVSNGSTVIGNTCTNNGDYGISLGGNCFIDQNNATGNTTNDISECTTCTFGTNHETKP